MSEWIPYRRHRPDADVAGDLRVVPAVQSPELGNERELLALLPPSYDRSERAYPVIYMQDGQNLFDEKTSYAGSWRVDRLMLELEAEGIEAVVVGIPNASERRFDEYSPWVAESGELRGRGGLGKAYLDFVLDTVMPLVEGAFRVSREPRDTGILGSSMGAVISLCAILEHPQLFGLAGLMSPALWFANREIFSFVEQASRSLPGRFYVDVGTAETSEGPASSSTYLDDARRLRRQLEPRCGERLLYHEDEGGRHEEAAWGRRLANALRFLLGPLPSG